MIKKNSCDRRFNTAAARIMASNKLPSDFFLPSREKDAREISPWPHRLEEAEKRLISGSFYKKETLPSPLHRSNSEEKLNIKKMKSPLELPKLRVFGIQKKNQSKLPPVSVPLNKQNISCNWFKDFEGNSQKLKKLARISNKILQESDFVREQITEGLH